MKRASLVWISARSKHPEADFEAQESFKKNKEHVMRCLPKEVNISDVDIWFQDEARFGQKGSLSRLWAIKGTRPRAIRQQQFKYTYLFGAVCSQRGDGIGLLLPYANTDIMKIQPRTHRSSDSSRKAWGDCFG